MQLEIPGVDPSHEPKPTAVNLMLTQSTAIDAVVPSSSLLAPRRSPSPSLLKSLFPAGVILRTSPFLAAAVNRRKAQQPAPQSLPRNHSPHPASSLPDLFCSSCATPLQPRLSPPRQLNPASPLPAWRLSLAAAKLAAAPTLGVAATASRRQVSSLTTLSAVKKEKEMK